MHHSILHSHIALHRLFLKRFFYQYFNVRKVAFIKEEKYARKIANACFFEKKLSKKGFLQNFAMISVEFLSNELRCHLYKQLAKINLSTL